MPPLIRHAAALLHYATLAYVIGDTPAADTPAIAGDTAATMLILQPARVTPAIATLV